jgi:phenylacetate-CoA ligase
MMPRNLSNTVKKHPALERAIRRVISCVPLTSRLGRGFWEWYAFYEQSETWTPSQLRAFQFDALCELLRTLKTSSSFYRERLSCIDVASLASIEEFSAKVPVLSRDEFRRNLTGIRATDWRSRRLELAATSGTTGNALRFHHAHSDVMRELAAVYSLWRRVGYQPGQSRRAEFRGLTDPGTIVKHYPDHRMIRCSILHLQREHVGHYAEQIARHGIEFFHGYPSAIYLLAREVVRSGLKFPQPKAMFFHSEEVYDWQVDAIQAAFPAAKLMAIYGCAERTVLAAWCEHRHRYHAVPQYSLFEVDRSTGQIIGTNLFNTVNGFVRYGMTDAALGFEAEPCSACQRPYPVVSQLAGRAGDYLHSVEHGWLAPGIVTYPFKGMVAVHEVQLYQAKHDEVVVRFTVCAGTLQQDVNRELARMREEFGRLLGAKTRCVFEQVARFERASSGKFKWIVCELKESRHGADPALAA